VSSISVMGSVRRLAVGFLGFSVILMSACVSLSAVSSGQIGCASDDITITDDSSGMGTRKWTAECNGRRFYCSAHSVGRDTTAQVACTEGLEAPVDDSAPAATAEDPAEKACGAVYRHASAFSPYWVAQSHGGVALGRLPEERDFRVVCMTIPENIRRCMFEGYRVSHKDSCEAMLSRIDAPTRNKIDSLFLAAAPPQPAP